MIRLYRDGESLAELEVSVARPSPLAADLQPVRFSPDGELLAVITPDDELQMWTVGPEPTCQASFDAQGCTGVFFGADDRLVLASRTRLYFGDPKTGIELGWEAPAQPEQTPEPKDAEPQPLVTEPISIPAHNEHSFDDLLERARPWLEDDTHVLCEIGVQLAGAGRAREVEDYVDELEFHPRTGPAIPVLAAHLARAGETEAARRYLNCAEDGFQNSEVYYRAEHAAWFGAAHTALTGVDDGWFARAEELVQDSTYVDSHAVSLDKLLEAYAFAGNWERALDPTIVLGKPDDYWKTSSPLMALVLDTEDLELLERLVNLGNSTRQLPPLFTRVVEMYCQADQPLEAWRRTLDAEGNSGFWPEPRRIIIQHIADTEGLDEVNRVVGARFNSYWEHDLRSYAARLLAVWAEFAPGAVADCCEQVLGETPPEDFATIAHFMASVLSQRHEWEKLEELVARSGKERIWQKALHELSPDHQLWRKALEAALSSFPLGARSVLEALESSGDDYQHVARRMLEKAAGDAHACKKLLDAFAAVGDWQNAERARRQCPDEHTRSQCNTELARAALLDGHYTLGLHHLEQLDDGDFFQGRSPIVADAAVLGWGNGVKWFMG